MGLPEDFPEIHINAFDNPEPGYVFISPCGIWGSFPEATPYLAILDNYGTPVFYEKLEQPAFDFKLQPNGTLSFHGGGYGWKNFILDSAYEVMSTASITGYNGTDFHDFKILENGNHLLLGYENRIVDMDTVVEGGQAGVTVKGTLIQEKDTAGNIVWQWSSWDHFKITDADTGHIDLTSDLIIDYVHTNAIEQDTDTSICISCRSMHEVTRINKNTGEIIWRMGGSQNEFSFIGDDTLGFSGQHDIRKLENGNFSLFDNGWYHPEIVSSTYEFQVDEVNKTVTCVKRYRSQPNDIMAWIMGSSQRLPGGNTLVGWGSGVPNVTEFKPDGTKALEFEFESVSYRAYKFPWKTNMLSANIEELDFGELYYETTAEQVFEITNHYSEDIIITWMHCHSDKYHSVTELPLTINAGDTVQLSIQFVPEEIGEYNDMLTFYAVKAGETKIKAFAQQISALGTACEESSIPHFEEGEISIYPNPTDGLIRISKNSLEPLDIKLTNIIGQLICLHRIPSGTDKWEFDISNEASGIYILQLKGISSGRTASWKILRK